MAEEKAMRLSQVVRKLNVGKDTIIEHLENKGFTVDRSPNAKISSEQYTILAKEFASSLLEKEEAESLSIGLKHGESYVIEKIGDKDRKQPDDDEILIKNVSPGNAQNKKKHLLFLKKALRYLKPRSLTRRPRRQLLPHLQN